MVDNALIMYIYIGNALVMEHHGTMVYHGGHGITIDKGLVFNNSLVMAMVHLVMV